MAGTFVAQKWTNEIHFHSAEINVSFRRLISAVRIVSTDTTKPAQESTTPSCRFSVHTLSLLPSLSTPDQGQKLARVAETKRQLLASLFRITSKQSTLGASTLDVYIKQQGTRIQIRNHAIHIFMGYRQMGRSANTSRWRAFPRLRILARPTYQTTMVPRRETCTARPRDDVHPQRLTCDLCACWATGAVSHSSIALC